MAIRIAACWLGILLFSGISLAQTAPPVDGFYWNPSEGGRGYSVESQDDQVFVAMYNYGPDGSPIFYSTQGTWDSAHRRIANAHLLEVSQGPWIGDPFSPVGEVVDRGPITFEFPTFTTARFTYNGHTVNLQRFLFGYGSSADSLGRGLWQTSFGDLGLYFGDILQIVGPCTVSSCAGIPEAFQGGRVGSSRVLVGGRDTDGKVFFLLDTSTSYYALYVFELRLNQWIGTEATFLKTDDIPTSGLPMFGSRVLGPSFASSSGTEPAFSGAQRDSIDSYAASLTGGRGAGEKRVLSGEFRRMLPALKNAMSEMEAR